MKNPRMGIEGMVVTLMRYGFKDEFSILAALDQIGQIEEAEFVRGMASALRSVLIQERGGETDRDDDV